MQGLSQGAAQLSGEHNCKAKLCDIIVYLIGEMRIDFLDICTYTLHMCICYEMPLVQRSFLENSRYL